MKKRIIIAVFFMLLLNMFISAQQNEDKAQKQRKCPRKVKVITKKIISSAFKEFKVIERKIVPSNETSVITNFSGIVKSIEKHEGDSVKVDDVILKFDTAKFEIELKTQNERAKVWTKTLFKRKNWKTKSERAEKQAETILNDAKEKIKDLKEKIQNSTIIASVDGVLGKIKVNAGDLLSNNFEIAKILNIDEMKIDVSDFSNKVDDLQKINIYVNELTKDYEAIVKKNEDESSLYISNTNRDILNGMTAKISILIKEYPEAITLSKDLILKENSIRFVYIVNGKRAKKVIIDVGHQDENGVILIEKGLAVGNELIISELISSKTGVISKDLRCIIDGKKIKNMQLNKKTGTYSKKKYIKPAVKDVVVTKAEVTVKEDKETVKKQDDKTVIKDKEINQKKLEAEKKVIETEKLAKKKELEKKEKEFRKKEKKEAEKKEKLEKLFKEKIVLENKRAEINKSIKKLNSEISVLGPKKSFFSKISLGVNVAYNKMTLENFEDVYGRIINPGIDIAFDISDKFDIYFSASYSSKSATVEWSTEELSFTNIPITLNIRYKFPVSEKLRFIGGAGVNYYTFEDVNPIETLSDSLFGFNMLAGGKYSISNTISFNMLFRMNFIKKDLEATVLTPDNTLDLGSMELLFGVSFKLGK